jgi:serine/threonine-protein kinase RsbW
LAGIGGEEDVACLRYTVPAEIGAVEGANVRLRDFLQGRGVDKDLVFTAVLALEEVVTNVVKYGFPADDKAERRIDVEADVQPGTLRLRIADNGRAFDPLTAPPPPLESPVEDRPIGGLGIHLLRNLADDVEYCRTEGQNVLTLRFVLDPKNRRFSCR